MTLQPGHESREIGANDYDNGTPTLLVKAYPRMP